MRVRIIDPPHSICLGHGGAADCLSERGLDLSEFHLMYLSDKREVEASRVDSRPVEEKTGRRNQVCAASARSPAAAIPLLVHGQTAYQKLLHGPGVKFLKSVCLGHMSEKAVHYGRLPRRVIHTPRASGHLPPVAIDSEHISDQTAYQIVFEGHVALAENVVAFAHPHAPVDYHVIPLVAICEPFAAFTLAAEFMKRVPALHGPRQQIRI